MKCDPYVKIALLRNGKHVTQKKTSVKKRSLSANYNESFSFEVTPDQIEEVQLLFTVFDRDKRGSNGAIGQVVVGCDTQGAELQHWMDMLDSHQASVTIWHKLQPMEEHEH